MDRAELPIEKTLSRNSPMSSIGSSVRSSHQTKVAKRSNARTQRRHDDRR